MMVEDYGAPFSARSLEDSHTTCLSALFCSFSLFILIAWFELRHIYITRFSSDQIRTSDRKIIKQGIGILFRRLD
ncbi:hypothetical protein BDV41DRAFT_113426 [Aspergillus transmontanensis]|uniref:Copper transporter n=1 Tax=Aspergillus transmontanensis TaxID=1034304 RepID=A0A5N6W6Y8_9EURO|nr:hypothetical protein BDV41DRAFT_113426 [Aspergillus transmontanensis]